MRAQPQPVANITKNVERFYDTSKAKDIDVPETTKAPSLAKEVVQEVEVAAEKAAEDVYEKIINVENKIVEKTTKGVPAE